MNGYPRFNTAIDIMSSAYESTLEPTKLRETVVVSNVKYIEF